MARYILATLGERSTVLRTLDLITLLSVRAIFAI
jgi:hypothetical protein